MTRNAQVSYYSMFFYLSRFFDIPLAQKCVKNIDINHYKYTTFSVIDCPQLSLSFKKKNAFTPMHQIAFFTQKQH